VPRLQEGFPAADGSWCPFRNEETAGKVSRPGLRLCVTERVQAPLGNSLLIFYLPCICG